MDENVQMEQKKYDLQNMKKNNEDIVRRKVAQAVQDREWSEIWQR